MNKTTLKNYAKLIVRKGANVQKGQDVIIEANVSDEYFIKYVVEEAYKAKARKVTVEWRSSEISILNYKYASVDTLSKLEDWEIKKLEDKVNKLPAHIYITSDDPDAFNKVNQEKATKIRKITGPIYKKYSDQMDNKYQWTIAGIPSKKWAKKVFPNERENKAVELLWDAILKTTRMYGNPIKNWDEHNKNLKEKCKLLNELHIKKLIYKSENGTDFSIRIKECMNFLGGSEDTIGGVTYNPNMPTEECFTSPDKDSAQGIVMATKPLSVMGRVVKDFGFKFENGKVIEVIAKDENTKKTLEELINMDAGASRLGEVALVPFDSPINETNILFFDTLYDENACCHLALGEAFDECIKDYQKLTEEEIKKVDLNESIIHVDFMIGSRDLNIKAITYDDKEIQIFKDGNWAI